MNKPETERQEEIEENYLDKIPEYANFKRSTKEVQKEIKELLEFPFPLGISRVQEAHRKGQLHMLFNMYAIEREKQEKIPPGQTAVTLYIPDGMTIGAALVRATSCGRRLWEKALPVGRRDLESCIWELQHRSSEQIQEAIDKLSQEKDD